MSAAHVRTRLQDIAEISAITLGGNAYAELKRKADSMDALVAALQEARRAIGDHFAPWDCYATGPLTGDAFSDLVECPACTFIKMHDAATAKGE